MKQAEKYVFYDGTDARFVAEFYRRRVFLHLLVRQWGMECSRKMKTLWPEIRRTLRNIGYDRIYAYNVETDPKWPRFMALFGFRHVRTRRGWTLMECQNA